MPTRRYVKKCTLLWDEFLVSTEDSDSEVEELSEKELLKRLAQGKSLKIKKIITRKRYKWLMSERKSKKAVEAAAKARLEEARRAAAAAAAARKKRSKSGGDAESDLLLLSDPSVSGLRRSGRKVSKPKRFFDEIYDDGKNK